MALAGAALVTAPASSAEVSTGSDGASWQEQQPSVTADPADLVADLTRHEAADVVVLTVADGHLAVETIPTVGQRQAESVLQGAQQQSDVVAVGIDHRVTATEDPFTSKQWGLQTVSAPSAWATTTGVGTVVAVVDSGVDGSHPDLSGAMVAGVNTRTDRGDYTPPTQDLDGHGTHVAGIIAARDGNGKGGAGVAPGASIMPVKVLDSDGSGWMADVIEGIIWATDHGADVINMSLGGADADFSAPAVEYARSQGVVVVAAAGNESSAAPSYPAALPGVVSVSALEEDGSVASYSNYGSTIDLAAPGSHILSTVPDGYAYMSGTSMAAPYVAGVAALIRAASPQADVPAVLAATAVDAGSPGRDDYYGDGVVNAFAAVTSVCPTCGPSSAPAPRTLLAQSVKLPQHLGALRTARLPARTKQGVAITSWTSRSASRCVVVRKGPAFRVKGLLPGKCRLAVSAPATETYAALNAVRKVRVTLN